MEVSSNFHGNSVNQCKNRKKIPKNMQNVRNSNSKHGAAFSSFLFSRQFFMPFEDSISHLKLFCFMKEFF